MKKMILGIATLLVSAAAIAAPVHVRGYTTRNGTYVAPHYRSSPDAFKTNNYSYPGNINPYATTPRSSNPYALRPLPRLTLPPLSSYGNTQSDDDSDPE